MKKSLKQPVRLPPVALGLCLVSDIVIPTSASAGAPPEINRQIGRAAYKRYTEGTKGNKPWLKSRTIDITCEEKLTKLNAFAKCSVECGPSRAKGALANSCYYNCVARYCESGR